MPQSKLDFGKFRPHGDGTEESDGALRGYRLARRVTENQSLICTVYEAFVASTGERVRVGAFPMPEEPRLHRRVRRLGKKRAGVRHPSVLPVREVFEDGGHLYMVSEWSEATSLAGRLEAGPLAPETAVRLLSQIAEGIEAMQAAGVTDGLVSPAAVVVDDAGNAVFSDLAFAASLSELVQPWAHPYARYFAPELGVGDHLGARTTVYSAGCILFEALAGTPPYAGDWIALSDHHSTGPIPALADHGVDLGDAIEPVIARALAADPQERFPSAVELMKAASAALAEPEAEAASQPAVSMASEPAGPMGSEPAVPMASEPVAVVASEPELEEETAGDDSEAALEAELRAEQAAQRAAAVEAAAKREEQARERRTRTRRMQASERRTAERRAKAEERRQVAAAKRKVRTAQRRAAAAKPRAAPSAAHRATVTPVPVPTPAPASVPVPAAAEHRAHPEPPPAADGGSAPAGEKPRLWRPVAVLAGCAVLAVGGYLAGIATDDSGALEIASGGPVSVELPSTWERRPPTRAVPGVRMATALAAGPRDHNDSGMVVWRTRGGGALPAGPSRPDEAKDQPVRIGRFEAIRHRDAGSARNVVTYSLPTTDGSVVAACHASGAAAGAALGECERVVSTLRLGGLRAISLQALAAEDRRIAGTLLALSRRRSADRLILAGAQTAAGQSFRAQRIQSAYGDARRSLERIAGGRNVPGRAELVRALARVKDAYRALVAATDKRSVPDYDAARQGVDRAEAALARLLARPAD